MYDIVGFCRIFRACFVQKLRSFMHLLPERFFAHCSILSYLNKDNMKIIETNITTLHDILDFFQTYSAKQRPKECVLYPWPMIRGVLIICNSSKISNTSKSDFAEQVEYISDVILCTLTMISNLSLLLSKACFTSEFI